MEVGFWILLGIMLILGFLAGTLIERFRQTRDVTQGDLYIVCNDPDEAPYTYLNPSTLLPEMATMERVTFKVKVIR